MGNVAVAKRSSSSKAFPDDLELLISISRWGQGWEEH